MNNKKPTHEVIIYKSNEDNSSISVYIENETVWLTIDQMAELFKKSRSTINEHILNIYIENELTEAETMRKIGNSDFSTTRQKRNTKNIRQKPFHRLKKII